MYFVGGKRKEQEERLIHSVAGYLQRSYITNLADTTYAEGAVR